MSDLEKALSLMWFFLPQEEPYSPHTKKKNEQIKNKKWHEACELYQKYFSTFLKEGKS